jgi:hypothetical protein
VGRYKQFGGAYTLEWFVLRHCQYPKYVESNDKIINERNQNDLSKAVAG